ncbi:MAG: hypothetical protein ACHP6I_00355 [Rickettsiales bacterium]
MKNKPVYNKNYEADSFLFLHSLSQSVKPAKHTANESNLNAEDGIKIYLKAVEKIVMALDESEKLVNEYNKIKGRPSEADRAATMLAEFIQKLQKPRDIIEEFLHGLAVVHNMDAKDLMELLHNRFSFINQNLELYTITRKISYLKDMRIVLTRLNDDFVQMLNITAKSTPTDHAVSSDFKV